MVIINGKEQNAVGKTIARIIAEGGYKPTQVAVERNEEIVPKASYDAVIVQDGDSIEIVQFMGGGQGAPASISLPMPPSSAKAGSRKGEYYDE